MYHLIAFINALWSYDAMLQTFQMALVIMHIFSLTLHFDMSLLLLTVTLQEYLISIAYCLYFHLELYTCITVSTLHSVFVGQSS